VETREAAGVRNIWFHLSLAIGSLLGLLLLVQSIPFSRSPESWSPQD
jgi:hypothetical protein